MAQRFGVGQGLTSYGEKKRDKLFEDAFRRPSTFFELKIACFLDFLGVLHWFKMFPPT